jgi:hypothetical protein
MSTASSHRLPHDLEVGDVVPVPQFREFHGRLVPADTEDVWRALHELPVSDVPVTRLLMGLRTPLSGHRVRSGPRSQVGSSAPTLWAVLPLPVIYEVAPTYALAAGIGRPWTPNGRLRAGDALDIELFREPGWAKIATDFRLIPTADGTVLTTETRVVTTDEASRRRFAAYWALIRPFSGAIRRDILRAVDRAATRGLRTG